MSWGTKDVREWLAVLGVRADESDIEAVTLLLNEWMRRWQALETLLMVDEARKT